MKYLFYSFLQGAIFKRSCYVQPVQRDTMPNHSKPQYNGITENYFSITKCHLITFFIYLGFLFTLYLGVMAYSFLHQTILLKITFKSKNIENPKGCFSLLGSAWIWSLKHLILTGCFETIIQMCIDLVTN